GDREGYPSSTGAPSRACKGRSPPADLRRRVSKSQGVKLVLLIWSGGQTAAESSGDRKRHTWILLHEIEERAAVQAQNLAIGLNLDGGSPCAVGEKGHFPEWRTSVKDLHRRFRCAAIGSNVDAHCSTRDKIEGISWFSLVEDNRAGWIRQRFEVRRELSERYPFEPLEQIYLTKKTRVV